MVALTAFFGSMYREYSWKCLENYMKFWGTKPGQLHCKEISYTPILSLIPKIKMWPKREVWINTWGWRDCCTALQAGDQDMIPRALLRKTPTHKTESRCQALLGLAYDPPEKQRNNNSQLFIVEQWESMAGKNVPRNLLIIRRLIWVRTRHFSSPLSREIVNLKRRKVRKIKADLGTQNL